MSSLDMQRVLTGIQAAVVAGPTGDEYVELGRAMTDNRKGVFIPAVQNVLPKIGSAVLSFLKEVVEREERRPRPQPPSAPRAEQQRVERDRVRPVQKTGLSRQQWAGVATVAAGVLGGLYTFRNPQHTKMTIIPIIATLIGGTFLASQK